jgi:hypothetical protein
MEMILVLDLKRWHLKLLGAVEHWWLNERREKFNPPSIAEISRVGIFL